MELHNEAGRQTMVRVLTPGSRANENERKRSVTRILENCDLNFCFPI